MPKTVIANPIELVTATLTRPTEAPAVQYATGDVMANSLTAPTVLTFANVADYAGQGGSILNLLVAGSANQATKPAFYIYLFDTAPTQPNDNAAWAPTDAEMATCLGWFALTAAGWQVANPGSGGDGNILTQWGGASLASRLQPFQCAAADRNLYAIVAMNNTYTPLSAEVFTFRLVAELR